MVRWCSVAVLRGNIVLYIANNFALLLTLRGLLLVLEYLCHINVNEASEVCVNSDGKRVNAMN